jgi:hypothetical protein
MTGFEKITTEEFDQDVALDLIVEHCRQFGGNGIHLWLSPQLAMVLVGNLQLALRHPGNVGPSSKQAQEIKQAVMDQLAAGDPTIKRLLAHGDDPNYDVPLNPNAGGKP